MMHIHFIRLATLFVVLLLIVSATVPVSAQSATPDTATVRFEMARPGRARLEAFDALRRRLLRRALDLGTGPQAISVEATA